MIQILLTLFLATHGIAYAHPDAHSPEPSKIGGVETNPVMQALPVEKMDAAEGRKLFQEFRRAQSFEIKALEHRQKLEIKEMKAIHGVRQKEWERREKDARHKFFAEHSHGPDRRTYIKDFMERRKVFLQMMADERANRIREQDVRLRSVKQDQRARLKEFQEALQRGERPKANIWPQ
ncbi:hypothetical protein WDW37_20540 [Bdellovibrionota bacterium FG-1]